MKIKHNIPKPVPSKFSYGDIVLDNTIVHLTQHGMVYHDGQRIGMWRPLAENMVVLCPLPTNR